MTEKKKMHIHTRTKTEKRKRENELRCLPLVPPSSMPFQLKSAVVIKFQQGLGATVQSGDGGWEGVCPDTKMTQFKRTEGARRKSREGDKCCLFTYAARLPATQSS